jgi:hypothetical protein
MISISTNNCVWWHMSVVPTWEAEIGRIVVSGQPDNKFAKLHLHGKNLSKGAHA